MALEGPERNLLSWLVQPSQPTPAEIRAVVTSLISEARVAANGGRTCDLVAGVVSSGFVLRALLHYCERDRHLLEVRRLDTAPAGA